MAKGEVSSRGGNRGNVGPADWEGVLKVEGNLSFFSIFFHICWISTRWFQIFFIFTPTWGNDPILTNIFQRG